MLKAQFQLINTDAVQASMTLTMSLKEWKELADLQPDDWPAWDFAGKIRDLIRHATTRFEERQDINH